MVSGCEEWGTYHKNDALRWEGTYSEGLVKGS